MRKINYLLLPLIIFALISCNSTEVDKNNNNQEINKTNNKANSKDVDLLADNIPSSDYAFADLPYTTASLEPAINSEILKLHYDKHHKGYYKKFLKAIEGTELQGKDLLYIHKNVGNFPSAVMNNLGGYYNHWVYWDNMSPDGGGKADGKLMQAINRDFGSWEDFQKEFNKAAGSHFGSGWAWLILNKNNKLEVVTTPNQNNPVMGACKHNGYPLLAIDVWEHAYYPKYKNKRGKYIENFWKVINWKEVSERFTMAQSGKYYMPVDK